MAKKFTDIDHSRIDTLSDGIFAIALTLLGFDLIGAIKTASEDKDLNHGLANEWPIFFSFVMGFFVLYAIWYQYHVQSQFAGKPHALMVWQHGFGFMAAALVPVGAALLGESINTPNMAWAVFYFGLLIFMEGPVQLLFFIAMRKRPMTVTDDSPFTGIQYQKMGVVLNLIVTGLGLISVVTALFYPWVALAIYGIYLLTKVNPVGSFNSSMPLLTRLVNLNEAEKK
jgi:uncharacterized membrane protein